ncbi:hypothetical protein [Massilia sp. CF038]|uniref:hypothetical protein n=1 Tax=Massilia sp. CF038 TaxID=1881045 RepID=UPI00091A8608|nr:hypothetical protein [Massilia sp. CF038]SHG94843.1 hypothetical protein SAMN05428948_2021 [Massilia sp. CF038]
MKEQAVRNTFNRELMGALAVYAVILMVSLSAGKGMQPGLARTLVMLSPMIGFMLALRVMVRQMARMDEFLRRTRLENLAMAAAITAGLSFTYGFLELAGFPKLSMFSVWCVLGGAWASITFLRCRVRFG